MSKPNQEHHMKSDMRGGNARMAPRRIKKPAARSNLRRPRHKTERKHSKRSPYLSARITEPLMAVAASITDRRDRAILLVLIDSELRPSELLGLSRGQIRVRIEKQKDKSLEASA